MTFETHEEIAAERQYILGLVRSTKNKIINNAMPALIELQVVLEKRSRSYPVSDKVGKSYRDSLEVLGSDANDTLDNELSKLFLDWVTDYYGDIMIDAEFPGEDDGVEKDVSMMYRGQV